MINNNPWMGLNPYQEDEKLYGRDDETKCFIRMLLSEHVVVLCGQSGVGKTSFIRACVCPTVRKRGILPVLIRLFHNDYNNSYISQIKQAIHDTLEELPKEVFIKELYPLKEGERESFLSFFKRTRIEKSNGEVIKPLIIIDQFEELYTLSRDSFIFMNEIDEAVSYDFRNETGTKVFPFQLIISIREDFISFIDKGFTCKEFRINRYYLEELNEEKAYKVITKEGNVNIDKKTAIHIIQRITGRQVKQDFTLGDNLVVCVSPRILSVYMYRLYEKSLCHNQGVISEELVKSYDAFNCFTDLYNEATEKLSPMAVDYLEDMLITSDYRRNNISEADIEKHVKKEELEILVRYNIIRRFSYLGDIRIELSSDVFCPIVYDRVLKRKKRYLLEAERNKSSLVPWVKQTLFCDSTQKESDIFEEYRPQNVDYDIFISYRREDGRDYARNIQQALKAHGYKRIFFDYDSIQKGEFNKRIIDAIYSCTDFILVLSPKSMKRCTKNGDPVANEIRTAVKYQKNIIPVTIDGKEVKWPKTFPDDLKFIRGLQFHDHKSDSYFEHSFEELCKKLICKKSDEK